MYITHDTIGVSMLVICSEFLGWQNFQEIHARSKINVISSYKIAFFSDLQLLPNYYKTNITIATLIHWQHHKPLTNIYFMNYFHIHYDSVGY